MNLKVQAGIDVLKLIAVAVVASLTTAFVLNTVPLAILGYIAGGVFMVYMLYIVYSIRLGQLEYQAKLKEMVDNK